MKVAAIQMVSGQCVNANLHAAERALAEAADQGAELALLPEYFCLLGRSDRDKLAVAEQPGQGPIQDSLSRLAQKHGLWIVGGTLPLATANPEQVRNSSLVFNPAGEQVARYDKIHLFDVDIPDGTTYRESATVRPGQELPPVVDVPGLCRVGLSICYDVRFPELYRHLAGTGVDVLMVPAAFTAFTGKDHWQVLLQARAIENTAYVVAPAQTGLHYGRRQSHGHALVIDPWGTVLADAGVSVGLAVAPVDPGHAQRVRAQMPSLQHRRPALF
jgi:nitrilase